MVMKSSSSRSKKKMLSLYSSPREREKRLKKPACVSSGRVTVKTRTQRKKSTKKHFGTPDEIVKASITSTISLYSQQRVKLPFVAKS